MFQHLRYQTIQSWSGKVKKINNREWVESQGNGEYYPPEGVLVFKTNGSETCYFYGGARHSTPDNWGMSNRMIKTVFKPLEDSTGNFKIESFNLLNHSVSQTSSFPKLAFADTVTIDASGSYLRGFCVNGIDLDLPTRERAFSDEIMTFETASETTFRTTIIRTPERAAKVPVNFKNEHLQSGDIPPPMMASSLTQVESRNTVKLKLKMAKNGQIKTSALSDSTGMAVLIGGTFHPNRTMSNVDLFFSSSDPWEEASSGGVWLLQYNLSDVSFNWTKKCDIEPRSFHKTVFIEKYLFVVGGVNVGTGQRYALHPVCIDIESWTVTKIVAPIDIFLSGHSLLKTNSNSCIAVGGYRKQKCSADDEPVDKAISLTFNVESVPPILQVEEKNLGCGSVAQCVLLDSPSDCLIVGGGTIQKWGIISSNISAGDPCDLAAKQKCLIQQNMDNYKDVVDWVNCQGPCKRWFHHVCLGISNTAEFRKGRKWFCNRSDCKVGCTTYFSS